MTKRKCGRPVLAVVAHPDDEVLGCGAAIARHAALGDEVHVLILAEGATSRDLKRDAKRRSAETKNLRGAASEAARILGAVSVEFAGLPDNRMDGVELLDVVKVVERKAAKFRPSRVYTHWRDDLNVDHRVAHDAVVTAFRPLPGSSAEALYFFETPSSTEWRFSSTGSVFYPNYFVDIRDFLARKIEALGAYGAEMREWPHARSIRAVEALARWRGASVGLEAAEAFVAGRVIEKGAVNVSR